MLPGSRRGCALDVLGDAIEAVDRDLGLGFDQDVVDEALHLDDILSGYNQQSSRRKLKTGPVLRPGHVYRVRLGKVLHRLTLVQKVALGIDVQKCGEIGAAVAQGDEAFFSGGDDHGVCTGVCYVVVGGINLDRQFNFPSTNFFFETILPSLFTRRSSLPKFPDVL